MADRLTENADAIVDEMKRKARRRLVGAIVLALAAAIILPILLEKEPRNLGDDVAVQIPPVDDSKFVNRLTAKAPEARTLSKADEKADAKSAPVKSEAKPEPPARAPAPAVQEAASAPPAETSAQAPAPIAEAKPPAGTEAKPSAAAEAKAPGPAATPPARVEGFVVQLAAFADDKGANALANKLKRGGYTAYVEPITTSRGTLWRVRVGSYASKSEADAARSKLKGEGFSGIVAPAT